MNVTFNNIMDITFDDICIKDEPIEEMVIENEPEEPSEEIFIKDEPLDGMDDQTYKKILNSQEFQDPCVEEGDKDEENGDTFKGKICSESRGQEIKEEEKQLKKHESDGPETDFVNKRIAKGIDSMKKVKFDIKSSTPKTFLLKSTKDKNPPAAGLLPTPSIEMIPNEDFQARDDDGQILHVISETFSENHLKGVEENGTKITERVDSPDLLASSLEDIEASSSGVNVQKEQVTEGQDGCSTFHNKSLRKKVPDEDGRDYSKILDICMNESSSSSPPQNLSPPTSPSNPKVFVQNKYSRKQCLQDGKGHTNSGGMFIDVKGEKSLYCDNNCRLKCSENINLQQREDICQTFWALEDWREQCAFIINSVKIHGIKRRKTTSIPYSRNYHREYYLRNKRVCKSTFLKTLCISNHRLDYAVRKKNKNGSISPDRRGCYGQHNKTPEETLTNIRNFLKDFPKFKSHYSNNQKLYFHPELTVQTIYQIYLDKIQEETKSDNLKVSYQVFWRYFRTYDNISIYLPRIDTCQLCSQFQIQIEALSAEDKENEIKKHNSHLQKASFARNYLVQMTNAAEMDSDILCFSFDMEKAQQIPYLSTSVSYYYKRHLWLLNLGINTRHDNKGYVCLWDESEGKRGSNEVCSSIFEFLLTQKERSNFKRIVTFSDGCGGQNRNKTFVSFMMFACRYFGIKEWEHTYLEPGHSYFPNDSNFGKIEKGKKKLQAIYSKSEWIQYIKRCNSKQSFTVIDMGGKILNFKTLSKLLTFPSHDSDGNEFSWKNLQFWRVSRYDGTVHYKTLLDPDTPEKCIDFSPRSGLCFSNVLPPKCPRVDISYEKYEDLMDVLEHIPPVHHDFFKHLPHQSKRIKEEVEFFPEGLDEDEDEI